MTSKIIEKVNKYYSEKIIEYGPTPKGVDWNGIDSQELRFKQLLKLINTINLEKIKILDFGCGFGSLLTYLENNDFNYNYIGFDISEEMLKQAKTIHQEKGVWINKLPKEIEVDYVIASGLFNVKQEYTNLEWESYIFKTLDMINKISVKGFSFNILTSYSDIDHMKDYLYYASPETFFKYCKTNYSKQVSLLHDYELYEFTIIITK